MVRYFDGLANKSIRKESKRVDEIDIIKAIGMISIVAFHANAPFSHFVQLFFISVFFICSGYCFDTDKISDLHSWKAYVIRLAKKTYVPYVVFNIPLILLHNFFVKIFWLPEDLYGKKDILIRILRALLFVGSESWAGATWFIRVLFLVLPLFSIINFFLKRYFTKYYLYIQVFISVLIILFVGSYDYLADSMLVEGVFQILGAYAMICIGMFIHIMHIKCSLALNSLKFSVYILGAVMLTGVGGEVCTI